MVQKLFDFIAQSFRIFGRARATIMAAALTYYTLLSLSPILILTVAIAGYFYGESLVQGEVLGQIAQFTSQDVADTVADLITNTSRPESGITASILSFLVLFYGASNLFTMLHDTFNIIWDVPYSHRSTWWYTIRQRLIGVAMVLSVGLLLLAVMILGSVLGALRGYVATEFPNLSGTLFLVERSITFLLVPLIFTGINRALPDSDVTWWDVLIPSFITAMLLLGSRSLISLYLQFSSTSAVYGAAGSLVVLLAWVYMMGLIVFYGAALCKAFAEQFGSQQNEQLPVSGD